MKKLITIFCSEDVPVKHLFDSIGWDVYEAVGHDDIFTLSKKPDNVIMVTGTGVNLSRPVELDVII